MKLGANVNRIDEIRIPLKISPFPTSFAKEISLKEKKPLVILMKPCLSRRRRNKRSMFTIKSAGDSAYGLAWANHTRSDRRILVVVNFSYGASGSSPSGSSRLSCSTSTGHRPFGGWNRWTGAGRIDHRRQPRFRWHGPDRSNEINVGAVATDRGPRGG